MVFLCSADKFKLHMVHLKGGDEGSQIWELEEILVAGTGYSGLSLTLTLLGIESTSLLAGQIDSALRVADFITQDSILGPLADQLATVGDSQGGALGLM